jgi:Ca-activated chloride channel homolog
MMIMKIDKLQFTKLLCLCLFCVFTTATFAQKESDNVNDGNVKYKKKQYTEAEIDYRKGLLKNLKSMEATYNLGNALYRQGKFPEAVEQYSKSVTLNPDSKTKAAAAFHNAGNAMLNQRKIAEAIAAYKQALKANPKDDETRYNLAYAQLLLKNQKNNQKKKQNQKQNQDKQNENQKNQQGKQNDQNKQQQQSQANQMTKENAQRILDALLQDEKNTQDKAKKQQVRNVKKADKDW